MSLSILLVHFGVLGSVVLYRVALLLLEIVKLRLVETELANCIASDATNALSLVVLRCSPC